MAFWIGFFIKVIDMNANFEMKVAFTKTGLDICDS
jgi:hypothetical protein